MNHWTMYEVSMLALMAKCKSRHSLSISKFRCWILILIGMKSLKGKKSFIDSSCPWLSFTFLLRSSKHSFMLSSLSYVILCFSLFFVSISCLQKSVRMFFLLAAYSVHFPVNNYSLLTAKASAWSSVFLIHWNS